MGVWYANMGVWQVGSGFEQCAEWHSVIEVKLGLQRSYSTVRATLEGGLRHLVEWGIQSYIGLETLIQGNTHLAEWGIQRE